VLLALLLLLPLTAEARPVLPPEAGAEVGAAFARAKPTWILSAASLSEDGVKASANVDGIPTTIMLGTPDTCAEADRIGPFCATFTPEVTPEARRTLAAAFAPIPATLWKDATTKDPRADDTKPPPPPETRAGLAIAAYLLALLLGLGAGKLKKSGYLLTIVASVTCAALPFVLPVPPLDGVALLLCVVVARGLSAASRPAFALVLAVVASVFALGVVEFASRLMLPAPLDPGRLPPFLLDGAADADLRCQVLAGHVDPARRDPEPSPRARTVLHLGDSMLLANGLGPGLRATDLLERDDPTTLHRNAGVAGTGPDVALVLAPALLARYRPELVVLHVFAGNDLADAGAPLPCCPRGALAVDGAEARPACTPERWTFDPDLALQQLRAPFPVLALPLASARHLSHAIRVAGLSLATRRRPEVDRERTLAVAVTALARVVAASGSRFRIVVVPDRVDLRHASKAGTGRAPPPHIALVSLLAATGSELVDAWPALFEARRARGEAMFMDTIEDDPHFSAEGHAAYARALAESRADR